MHRASVPKAGQHVGIGWLLESSAADQQFILAQNIIAAVGMVVENHGQGSCLVPRPDVKGGNRLDAVQVEHQRLQDESFTLLFREAMDPNWTRLPGKVAKQVTEFPSPCFVRRHGHVVKLSPSLGRSGVFFIESQRMYHRSGHCAR